MVAVGRASGARSTTWGEARAGDARHGRDVGDTVKPPRTLPRDPHDRALWTHAGMWRPAYSGKGALIGCPDCGREFITYRRNIGSDGTVSYHCPFHPCTFDETVQLEDWQP